MSNQSTEPLPQLRVKPCPLCTPGPAPYAFTCNGKCDGTDRATIVKRRADRLAQAQHRGSRNSHVTDLEDALIVLCWEFGHLSEGQAAKALELDILGARQRRDSLRVRGLILVEALLPGVRLRPRR